MAADEPSTQTQDGSQERGAAAGGVPLFAGRFELKRKIGSGANGTVHEAFDIRLRRRVALKLLTATTPDARERFAREGPTLAAVHHKGIAAVYDAGEADGRSYIAMEYIEGQSLADFLRAGLPPATEAIRIAEALAEAIGGAHAAGVLHRDLKPGNVMIGVDGEVTVLDFGLAKSLQAEGGQPLTASGAVLGTPQYMSPEQVEATSVDERTDVWAWGCILFELLTGVRAVKAASPRDALMAVLSKEPDWDLLPADAPPGLTRLVRECLTKEKDRRPANMAAVRQQLYAAMTSPSDATASLPKLTVDVSPAARRFHALLRHAQSTDAADTAAVAVLQSYAERLRDAIKEHIDAGVLATDSAVNVRTTPGAIIAVPAGFRAPLVSGSALTFRIGVSDPRMYAGLEAHLQVEIPEPPGASLQVRWMPVDDVSGQSKVIARLPLADLLPLPPEGTLQAITVDDVLAPAMDLLLARAEAALIRKGYQVPSAEDLPTHAAPIRPELQPFQQLDAPARELLIAIISGMQPRQDFHEFWAIGTFAGWEVLLIARRGSPVGQKTLEDRSGKFELADLEGLRAEGYVRLDARGRSEYRGTITPKAFAEYDAAMNSELP